MARQDNAGQGRTRQGRTTPDKVMIDTDKTTPQTDRFKNRQTSKAKGHIA